MISIKRKTVLAEFSSVYRKILESNEKVYWDDLGLRNFKAEGGMDSYIEQATRDREFGPLEKIRDNHPKYVISATPFLT